MFSKPSVRVSAQQVHQAIRKLQDHIPVSVVLADHTTISHSIGSSACMRARERLMLFFFVFIPLVMYLAYSPLLLP